MFMKATYTIEKMTFIFFLLKCLIEELQDDSILKSVEMIVMSNLTPEQRKKAGAYFQAVRLFEEQKEKKKSLEKVRI